MDVRATLQELQQVICGLAAFTAPTDLYGEMWTTWGSRGPAADMYHGMERCFTFTGQLRVGISSQLSLKYLPDSVAAPVCS